MPKVMRRFRLLVLSKFLRVQPCWFALYQRRAEKGLLMTNLILLDLLSTVLLPHISGHVYDVMHRGLVGHKLAAPRVMFL